MKARETVAPSTDVGEVEDALGREGHAALKGDILVVDDVPANQRLLSNVLTEQGYKVRSAINGHMALMAARAAPPDLILLDINMPGMTGYEVSRHLKADARTRDVPIIFISGLDETEDKVRAFTVGGVDYVTKPFQIAEVLARVETHLSLRRLRTELQRANDELETRVEERTAQVLQLAVDKGKLERDLQMAREVQASFLPEETPQIPGWEFVVRWRPAREVSGDYYDFLEGKEGKIGLVIADVAGKGMPAALFMVLTRSTVRASVDLASMPADGIARANRLLCADASGGMFVTLFYATLDPAAGEVTYVSAGHEPPLLCRAESGELVELWPTGMALGVIPEASFEQRTVQLCSGDLLVLYTDGLTDALDAHEVDFGLGRVQRVVLEHRHGSAVEVVAALEQAVDDHTGSAPPFDDTALLVIRKR